MAGTFGIVGHATKCEKYEEGKLYVLRRKDVSAVSNRTERDRYGRFSRRPRALFAGILLETLTSLVIHNFWYFNCIPKRDGCLRTSHTFNCIPKV